MACITIIIASILVSILISYMFIRASSYPKSPEYQATLDDEQMRILAEINHRSQKIV